MAKHERLNLRFAVGSQDRPRSSLWRCYSYGSEVYVSHGTVGGVEKISLHSSTICRRAFTAEEGPAEGHSDRIIQRWHRAAALPGRMSYALVARFPSDYLSTALERPKKTVEWVPAAPIGQATVVEFVFAGLDEAAMLELAAAAGRTIISYTSLPNGEAFVLSYCHEPWLGEPFTAPGLFGREGQYVVAPDDPTNSGRPTRLTLFLDPRPGQPVMIVDELGAYHALLDMQFKQPMGTLSRSGVLKSGKTK